MDNNHSSLIKTLGGPTRLAERLGYGKTGASRVCNWQKRGIPLEVLVRHQSVFGPISMESTHDVKTEGAAS